MTYEESSALMLDIPFRGRIKVGAVKYADYIFNEASNTQGHASRYRWAQTAMQQPDQTAAMLQPPVVMDSAVQSAGPEISDAALQAAIEGVVNKLA